MFLNTLNTLERFIILFFLPSFLHSFLYFFVSFYIFSIQCFSGSPDCPGTYPVDQYGLKLRELSASET